MQITLTQHHFSLLCRHIDWSRPELAAPAAFYHAGDAAAAALAFVGHLRARPTPRLGYDAAYVAHVRATAGPEAKYQAIARLDEARERGWFSGLLRGLGWYLSTETLMLAADTEAYRRVAATALENEPNWQKGTWGEVFSICELMRALWPVAECEDEFFVVFFCWMLTRLTPEWQSSRRWAETMLGNSGHNWYVHTYFGFWMAGLFFPELKGLAQFRSFAPELLERELLLLFEVDGWSLEGSPGYHEATAVTISQLCHIAEINGIVISDKAKSRLRAIAQAGYTLWAPDGENPNFGDHGRTLHIAGYTDAQRTPTNPGTLMRVRAVQYNLPELKFVAEALNPSWKPPYGCLPGHGPERCQDLWPAYQKLEASAPGGLDTALVPSGLYAMRQNWTSNADYLAIVAGPLGPLVSSHKHADTFSFELYSKGRRILVDNGYGSTDEPGGGLDERLWREGSSAHNIGTVDGAGVVPVQAEYRYGATIFPIVDAWRTEPDFAYFSGVHEGYRHLAEPLCATRRKIFWLRGQYFILIDRFTADTPAPHEYALHFHINASSELQTDGCLVTSGDGGNLLIVPVEGARGTAHIEPCPHPMPGYENPDHLSYTATSAGGLVFATLLVPFEGAAPTVEIKLLPVEADDRVVSLREITALEITVNGRRDIYVDQHMEWNLPWRAAGCEGSGRLFHSRCAALT